MRNPACEACELHRSATNRCIWGEWSGVTSDVMVIGEAPGAMEDMEARPFVGASGKLLRSALKDVGLTSYYITNVAKCRPKDNKLPDNKKAIKAIFGACMGYLHAEIAEVKPKFILTLGNTPLQALTGMSGITKYRGTPYTIDMPHGKVTVFPAYHPAYVLRGPGLEKIFKLDLTTFVGLTRGWTGEDFWAPMVNQVVTKREQLEFIRGAHEKVYKPAGFVQVYDIENLGIWKDGKYVPTVKRSNSGGDVCSPEEGTIPWLGVAYHHEDGRNVQFIIPWEHPKASEAWTASVTELAKLILEDRDYKRVAQYGKSDDRWLYTRGIYPHRTYDTYNAEYMLDENIPHGIETIAKLEVGAPVWGEGFDYSALGTMPFAEVADYLGKDLYATGRTYFPQRKKLAADQGLARVFTHIMMPGDRMICEIQQHGLWVFEDVLAEKTHKFIEKRDFSLVDLARIYLEATGATSGSVNWNSPDQKQRILFEELGLPVYKTSKKTGKPSTDKDVLARLEEQTGHPVVVELRKYQKIEMLCRFLKRWRAKVDRAKEVRGEPRIYTELNIAKVVTGRLSSVDPDGTGDNLQQVPSRGEGAELREIFGAPPGYKLIEADYSQIELVMASFVAPEENMKRLFRENKDMHYATALAVRHPHLVGRLPGHLFGVPKIVLPDGTEIEVSKADRKKAKPVNFGFLFEMQAKRFVSYALTDYGESYTLGEAKRFRQIFFGLYPGLIDYYKRTKEELRATGEVRTCMGRIRRLPDIFSPDDYVQMEAEREAINAKVQSPANDLTLTAGIYLHDKFKELGWDVKIVLFVHDAIMAFAKDGLEEKAAALIKQTMEKIVPKLVQKRFGVTLDVPLRAEVTIGTKWGQGTEWHETEGE